MSRAFSLTLIQEQSGRNVARERFGTEKSPLIVGQAQHLRNFIP
jgi:hypothetical protein